MCKIKTLFGRKIKTTSGIYGNPIEIIIIRKNQLRILMLLKLRKKRSVLVILICKDSKPPCEFSSWYIAWFLL